jgi:hypothetical protein
MREEQDELLRSKGEDYTRSDPDRLANFKRLAKDLNIRPIQVWAIYSGKHWDALMAFAKTGKVESEDIRTRFIDLQNYLYLGQALLEEDETTIASAFKFEFCRKYFTCLDGCPGWENEDKCKDMPIDLKEAKERDHQ